MIAAPPPLPPDDALLSDRVRSLYAHAASSLVGNALGGLIVAAMFISLAGEPRVGAWLVAFALLWLARLGLAVAHRRAGPAGVRNPAAWLRRWNVASLVSAGLWGLAAWLFYARGTGWHDTVLLLIVSGLGVGSIPSLATQRGVYLGFVSLAYLPMIVRIGQGGRTQDIALAAVMGLILATAVLLGRNYRSAFEQLLELKARTAQLADRLRSEQLATDDARRQAETANQAKTRFLAAASHDLRQPLQALRLFTEALRERVGGGEHRELAGQIDRSVEALERLFDELLDISRIDSGVVEVRSRDFTLGEVVDRLRLQFEPLAFEKGLALTWRGGRHAVHADPVLVERILRNLVSNAIRCTEDGGVLVAARRRGASVVLQVWDSGVGIRSEDRDRVFDEFVQLARPASAGPAGRRKGLGLGLAIVRRLAALMDAPLELRSTPGRGSVFSLRLPAAGSARTLT